MNIFPFFLPLLIFSSSEKLFRLCRLQINSHHITPRDAETQILKNNAVVVVVVGVDVGVVCGLWNFCYVLEDVKSNCDEMKITNENLFFLFSIFIFIDFIYFNCCCCCVLVCFAFFFMIYFRLPLPRREKCCIKMMYKIKCNKMSKTKKRKRLAKHFLFSPCRIQKTTRKNLWQRFFLQMLF